MPEPEQKSGWFEDLPFDAAQRREVFARFGAAMYFAQCIEKQLGILLATTFNPEFLRAPPGTRDRWFDEEFKKTLGRLLTTLRRRVRVTESFENQLRKSLEIRNRLAHEYFWQRAGDLLTRTGRERMIIELQEMADHLSKVDERLIRVGKAWLATQGISDDHVEAEVQRIVEGAKS